MALRAQMLMPITAIKMKAATPICRERRSIWRAPGGALVMVGLPRLQLQPRWAG
jgi:hypothetical protein